MKIIIISRLHNLQREREREGIKREREREREGKERVREKEKGWQPHSYVLSSNLFHVCCCFSSQSQDEEESTVSVPVFRWIAVHNLTSLDHCRNSKQGHTLITDELG